MASHSANPKLAQRANAINNFFGEHTAAFMLGPVIILAAMLYFVWGRTKLTWLNGLMIDDRPAEVLHYQFKRTMTNAPMIYLRTQKKLYILYAAPSQDGKKLPDAKVMAAEEAMNEIQIGILKSKLETSTATEKAFWFFSKDVVLSFCVFIVIIAIAFSPV